MPFQPDPVWLLARVFGPAAGFLLTLVSAAGSADFQTLKGHGGPVMDIDVSLETGQVATAREKLQEASRMADQASIGAESELGRKLSTLRAELVSAKKPEP